MATPERRGAHVLDAVVKLVADKGLASVSLRAVAAAGDVSLAQVQYYFRSKDELIAAAFEHVAEEVERRAATVDTSGGPREVLTRLLRLWVPSDAQGVRAARVWLAFTAAAATSDRLREINTGVDDDLRAGFTGLLRGAQEAGELDASLDPEVHAAVLLAVVDGLVTQAVIAPADSPRALMAGPALTIYLDQLFRAPAERAADR